MNLMEPDETLHWRITWSPSHKYILPLGSSNVVGIVIIPAKHNIILINLGNITIPTTLLEPEVIKKWNQLAQAVITHQLLIDSQVD